MATGKQSGTKKKKFDMEATVNSKQQFTGPKATEGSVGHYVNNVRASKDYYDKQETKKIKRSGLGKASGKPKGIDTYVVQLVEEGPAKKHKNIQLKKGKKFFDSSGNIEFKAKGGRAGYKVGGAAKRGVSKILIKK